MDENRTLDTTPDREEEIRALLARRRYGFADLAAVMRLLRAPGGCPWDREQTHASIRNCMIEEAYEAVEAIDTANPVLLREELGDVLFQVFFHARIEAEAGRFTVDDVVHDICCKMIHRHPHVFSSCTVSDSGEALTRWEAIKTEEKQRNTLSSRLRAVPPMLPALMRAAKIVGKTNAVGTADPADLVRELCARAEDLCTSAAPSGAPAVPGGVPGPASVAPAGQESPAAAGGASATPAGADPPAAPAVSAGSAASDAQSAPAVPDLPSAAPAPANLSGQASASALPATAAPAASDATAFSGATAISDAASARDLSAAAAPAPDVTARLGALLWTAVRLSVLLGVDAEQALSAATEAAIAAVETAETAGKA